MTQSVATYLREIGQRFQVLKHDSRGVFNENGGRINEDKTMDGVPWETNAPCRSCRLVTRGMKPAKCDCCGFASHPRCVWACPECRQWTCKVCENYHDGEGIS